MKNVTCTITVILTNEWHLQKNHSLSNLQFAFEYLWAQMKNHIILEITINRESSWVKEKHARFSKRKRKSGQSSSQILMELDVNQCFVVFYAP